MRAATNEVTVKMDVSGLADGQEAGVAHFAKTYSSLGVVKQGTVRTISLNTDGVRLEGPVLTQNALWVRSSWGFDGLSRWSYSLDGKVFTAMGTPYPLTWGHYRGDRIGLFTVNAAAEAGFVDFQSFRYSAPQR
jgi:hypothetical protein